MAHASQAEEHRMRLATSNEGFVPVQIEPGARPAADIRVEIRLSTPGRHLRARRPDAAALYPGAVGGRLRGAAAALGRGAQNGVAHPCRFACRRDAGGDVEARPRQDPSAYLWSYCTTPYEALQAVVYDFAETRVGTHPRAFLAGWSGKLVSDRGRIPEHPVR